ncbi:hypothetical protein F183_A30700 [Bryobacterales bacterium F-183]|nr:hypothetical protein F183_A30700 [Bryobacterales bacterium F-183]
MFRVILGIIVSLFMISLLRMIMGAISREIGGDGNKASSSAGGGQGKQQQPSPPKGGAGGELRKCPSCGAYHATTSIAAKNSSGEMLHFCSLACREKFTV